MAPTSVVKTLQQITAAESQLSRNKGSSFCAPSRPVLEMLAESCNGDIRNAINSLQVVCLQGEWTLRQACLKVF